jgi:CDP-diacylglycerol---serine O-phosphatidyltransferase
VIQGMPSGRPRLPRSLERGAYLLPSMFTIANMMLGFYAIVCGLQGDFRLAVGLVLAAALVDTLDGLIARMTGTESEFGKEYDSLADVITFGATPALLTYLWGLADLHRDAWLLPLFYMVCTATRLARFNVQHKVIDKRWFVGLPTPAAAATICSLLFYAPDPEWRWWMTGLVGVALLLVGLLMVSNFRYRSVKGLDVRKRVSYRIAVPLAALALVIFYQPYAFFLIVSVAYTLSGPLLWLFSKFRSHSPARPADEAAPAEAPPPPPDDLPPYR